MKSTTINGIEYEVEKRDDGIYVRHRCTEKGCIWTEWEYWRGFEFERDVISHLKNEAITTTFYNVEEVLTKTVKASGNSGRIYLPPSWIGKEVKVILIKDD